MNFPGGEAGGDRPDALGPLHDPPLTRHQTPHWRCSWTRERGATQHHRKHCSGLPASRVLRAPVVASLSPDTPRRRPTAVPGRGRAGQQRGSNIRPQDPGLVDEGAGPQLGGQAALNRRQSAQASTQRQAG